MQSGRKTRSADKQDQGSQVFQAIIINSSVDQVKEKKIAFLQGNFDMLVFRRIAVLQFTIVIQCVYYHVWRNTYDAYISVINRRFKVKTENQKTSPRADSDINRSSLSLPFQTPATQAASVA